MKQTLETPRLMDFVNRLHVITGPNGMCMCGTDDMTCGQILAMHSKDIQDAQIQVKLLETAAALPSVEESPTVPVSVIKTLDAKWLDPECHKGCQSLVWKAELEAAKEYVRAYHKANGSNDTKENLEDWITDLVGEITQFQLSERSVIEQVRDLKASLAKAQAELESLKISRDKGWKLVSKLQHQHLGNCGVHWNDMDCTCIKKLIEERDKAQAEAAGLREALKQLEFISNLEDASYCAACQYEKRQGHSEHCWLSKILSAEPPKSVPYTIDIWHPEATCADCGTANVIWFAPNELWNAVMRKDDQPEPIICPRCFAVRATKAGIANAFQLVEADTFIPRAKLTELPNLILNACGEVCLSERQDCDDSIHAAIIDCLMEREEWKDYSSAHDEADRLCRQVGEKALLALAAERLKEPVREGERV